MTGANCSIFGCLTSRKSPNISIFYFPKKDDEYSTNWRNKLVNIITRDRVIDKGLRSKIEKRSLCVCELHFAQDVFIYRK